MRRSKCILNKPFKIKEVNEVYSTSLGRRRRRRRRRRRNKPKVHLFGINLKCIYTSAMSTLS